MEPRTIVGQPIGEGDQLRPDGLRRHHPGAIVNRKAVRMRGIGTLCIVNSIRGSSARRRRATRDVLPSDTAISPRKGQGCDSSCFWLGAMATTVLASGIDAPAVSTAEAVVLASGAWGSRPANYPSRF
jgi:hypothetical protein